MLPLFIYEYHVHLFDRANMLSAIRVELEAHQQLQPRHVENKHASIILRCRISYLILQRSM